MAELPTILAAATPALPNLEWPVPTTTRSTQHPITPQLSQAFVADQRVQVNIPAALNARKWSPGVAALLSFIFPGLGQIYKGNIASGLVWMFFVILGYIMLVIPGAILHLICIFSAASGDPTK